LEKFRYSLPAMRVVAIANPNNPTGTVLPESDLVTIVRRAGAVGCVALIDGMTARVGRNSASVLRRTGHHETMSACPVTDAPGWS
jgi:histidinol-phosphate/aromatic aminotransferase/cobyric acid decarboxylase-like protein